MTPSDTNADAAQVAMIGLAVMGANLARNLERTGLRVAVYNRSTDVTERFMKDFGGDSRFVAARSLPELVASLERPRKIFLMIQAGRPVDAVLDQLLSLLSPGDIVLEGGNSYYLDTVRREAACKEKGVRFLGVGISGGEEGALNGASIMPSGPRDAWELVAPMLEGIAARADGEPCTTYIGPDGSGHFVKMVHNGIEYGDMQLIAEAYHLLRRATGSPADRLAEVFSSWNEGVLQSFLIEITAKVLRKRDPLGDGFLVDAVLDKAGQKGTGKWTAAVGLELGVSIPTIAAAVDARVLSSMKAERVVAEEFYRRPAGEGTGAGDEKFVRDVHDALYAAKILSYAQGMALLAAASKDRGWKLDLGGIAAIWKGGCIIRARFLDEIRSAYAADPELKNLLLAPSMREAITGRVAALRRVVGAAVAQGVAVPALSASMAYFDSYTTALLPQNLTQAQRDMFGAHTYERVDREGIFHSDWEG